MDDGPIPRRREEFIEPDKRYIEEVEEEMARARREDWLEYLRLEGSVFAVLGSPGYSEALATHYARRVNEGFAISPDVYFPGGE